MARLKELQMKWNHQLCVELSTDYLLMDRANPYQTGSGIQLQGMGFLGETQLIEMGYLGETQLKETGCPDKIQLKKKKVVVEGQQLHHTVLEGGKTKVVITCICLNHFSISEI